VLCPADDDDWNLCFFFRFLAKEHEQLTFRHFGVVTS
jgi:hypothetical protein